MPFSERDWRRLLAQIKDRLTVPVVGPDLLVLETDVGRESLFDYLARHLVDRLNVDRKTLPERYALRDVMGEYLSRAENEPTDLYLEIRDLMEKAKLATPQSLKKLAAISAFDLFVSTTFDDLLERALDEVRFCGEKKTCTVSYNLRSAMADLPDGYRPTSTPHVFHLFGRLGPLDDFAIREDDVLRFTHRLQSRDHRPPNLFDELKNRNLLVLGCGFYGWLLRFFVVATKGERFFVEGSRGVFADDQTMFNRRLLMFLNRHKARVYEDGDAVQFVDELHSRWCAQFGDYAPPAPAASPSGLEMIQDSVFISYASEDRAVAEGIRDSLKEAGVQVWFDESTLEPGDAFKEKILDGIERCSRFLPVISRHTILAEKRFFRREWAKAIDEAEEWPEEQQFIQPIVIDDTSVEDRNIPREFKARQWLRLEENGRLPQKFVEQTKEHIRQCRRERGMP